MKPAAPENPKTRAAQARDEWLVDVLCDLELSPAARLVGAYLGLAVDLDSWPPLSAPLSAIGDPQMAATRLGLPVAIVAKAVSVLVARGRLGIWKSGFRLEGGRL